MQNMLAGQMWCYLCHSLHEIHGHPNPIFMIFPLLNLPCFVFLIRPPLPEELLSLAVDDISKCNWVILKPGSAIFLILKVTFYLFADRHSPYKNLYNWSETLFLYIVTF